MQYLKDFDSLVGSKNGRSESGIESGITRRNFMQTAASLGFAAAVAPVCAQTMIKTDRSGLNDGVANLVVDGVQVPMYFAKPEGKTSLPVILVVSEIFGVHEHIADVARRFAKLGYLALAPELFVRQGDARNAASIAELMKDIISKVPDAQVMGDLDAAVAWAAKNGGDTRKLGITGFCWGGRITWMYAAHNPQVLAGVAWYGRLFGEVNALTPKHPIDIAASLKTPVLGLYGAKDQGISAESVFKMETELKKGASKSEFKIYENSGHAFHADYRPSYNEADAKDGWKRCLDWFKKYGVA